MSVIGNIFWFIMGSRCQPDWINSFTNMEFWKLQNPCKTVTSGSGWEFNDIRFEFSSRL